MNFLNKINLVLLSILTVALSLSVFISLLDNLGIYLGITAPLIISGILVYKNNSKPALKFYARSLLIVTILTILGFILGFSYLKNVLEGF